jgi:hypothetical protein
MRLFLREQIDLLHRQIQAQQKGNGRT